MPEPTALERLLGKKPEPDDYSASPNLRRILGGQISPSVSPKYEASRGEPPKLSPLGRVTAAVSETTLGRAFKRAMAWEESNIFKPVDRAMTELNRRVSTLPTELEIPARIGLGIGGAAVCACDRDGIRTRKQV